MKNRRMYPMVLGLWMLALILSSCSTNNEGVWDYVVMGVMTRNGTSFIPDQYAEYIEQDLGVTVNVQEQERWEPDEILQNMRNNNELQKLIEKAEVITFDFSWEYLNLPEGLFASEICKGADNQECLRSADQKAKDDWTAIIDTLAEIRSGSPVLLRVFIIGDHIYGLRYWTLPDDKKAVIKSYYDLFQQYVETEGRRRGVTVIRALPDPYFESENPPAEFLQPDGFHFSEIGSLKISDALRKSGYELQILK